MKKIYLFAAASLMLASCAKDIVETPSTTTETDDTEKGYVTLTFTASHPERTSAETISDDAATKTAIQDDGKVTWEAGDRLKLILEGGEEVPTGEAVISEDRKTATFTATIKEGKAVKYAVYPTSIKATLSDSGEDLNVTIPNVQDGTFANASIEVGTVDENNKITLKNVCSLLKFKVANDGAAKVFIGGNGAPFAGTAKVNAGILDATYTAAVDVLSYSPNIEIDIKGDGPYYAAILPAKTTGLSMQIYDGSNKVLAENISSNVLDAGRRTIKDLGELSSTKFEEIIFVSNNGIDGGDGKSWDTAWTPKTLFDNLSKQTFKGTAIFVGGGDMKLTSPLIQLAANTKFRMYGGYPENLNGRDITSRDLNKCQTNFSGNKNADEDKLARIFNYNGGLTETTIDGIGFCNTYQNAAGEQYTGTALLVGEATNAYFFNCRIFDNKKEGNAIVRVGGSSVAGRKATATFERCTFSNNTVSGKGLIQVQAGGNLTIRDCDFTTGNKVMGEDPNGQYKDNYRVCYKTGGVFVFKGVNNFAADQFKETSKDDETNN